MQEGVQQKRGSGGGPTEDRRQIAAWSRYNWGDHGWAAPVAAVLIGPWMLALATNAVGTHGRLVTLGPLSLSAAAYPSAMLTLAALIQLVVLPAVGAAADARMAKRRWLVVACALGSVVCGALALTGGNEWLLAGLLFLLGSLCEGVSDLVWNGMLPELASPPDRNRVSGRATAVGYAGAAVLLALDLVFVDAHSAFGLSKSGAVRLCFLGAGLWWAGFGLTALRRLRPKPRTAPAAKRNNSWAQLRTELVRLRTMPDVARFVLAYLCFADAVSAVISLSSTFLTHVLFGDNASRAAPFLFVLILLVQIVAVVGSVTFVRLASRTSTKAAVLTCLVVWCAVVVFAYAVLNNTAEALVLGLFVGVGLGGTTALTRSLFAQMIPAGSEATFFSLFEVCSQGTSWVAPLLFTVVVSLTGSFRQAILSLIILFVLGFVLLLRVDTHEAARQAAEAGLSPALE